MLAHVWGWMLQFRALLLSVGCGASAVLIQILCILRPSASNLSCLQKTRPHRLLDLLVVFAAERGVI